MRKIYKYTIRITDKQSILMRLGKIIHIGLDPAGVPCVWAEVDPESELIEKIIFIVSTGGPLCNAAKSHIFSFNQGPFMWHVYE